MWEYRQAFRLEAGKLKIQDMEFALYIANNLLLFVPMGVLLSECCDACRKNAFVRVLSVSCLASALLEINQLVFHIGLFELDDILNNTIGAILGFGFYGLVKKLMQILRRGNRL